MTKVKIEMSLLFKFIYIIFIQFINMVICIKNYNIEEVKLKIIENWMILWIFEYTKEKINHTLIHKIVNSIYYLYSIIYQFIFVIKLKNLFI